jgi:predicted ester cyclase
MGAAENLATHIRWAEAENSQDVTVDRWREFVHDDIEIIHMTGDTISGIEAMVENLVDSIETMPDWKNTIDDRFATDDRVVCRWRIRGVPTGSESPVEVAGISLWEFQDGKARRGWILSNATYLMQQGVTAAGSYSVHAHDGSVGGAA